MVANDWKSLDEATVEPHLVDTHLSGHGVTVDTFLPAGLVFLI